MLGCLFILFFVVLQDPESPSIDFLDLDPDPDLDSDPDQDVKITP